jgi:hypothetical protein
LCETIVDPDKVDRQFLRNLSISQSNAEFNALLKSSRTLLIVERQAMKIHGNKRCKHALK